MSIPSDSQTLLQQAQAPLDLSNPLAQELKAVEYQEWRHHPVTKCFLLYLAHHSLSFQREALDRWRAGNLKLVEEQELRGRIATLEELCALDLGDIQRFYGKQSAPEAARQSARQPLNE